MISRYSRPNMASLWSEEAMYRTWLDVEVMACEGWSEAGKIPPDAIKEIREKANFEIARVQENERVTKHDLAAFVSEVQRHVGDAGRFIHMGLTSSDVVDTAFSYRMKRSGELLVQEISAVLKTVKDKALKYKTVPMMGRTHGIHAEPITLGTKWLLWYDLLERSRVRLLKAIDEVSVGKISGAVGNYAHIPPAVEIHVCKQLGLRPDTLSTQIISRDRYAAYFSAIALLGSCIETIVVEIRHLQRTEVGEMREGFTAGQKGSSAMPHKRNPIQSENLTGLARLLRGMLIPALEDCALWHERDISHSSVERVIGPDANILADFMLGRLGDLLLNLEVFPARMAENIDSLQGVIYSQSVLLRLLDAGMSRDDAYEVVQKNALAALDKKISFHKLLKDDSRVTKVLSTADLAALFEPARYTKNIDYLYKKVLG